MIRSISTVTEWMWTTFDPLRSFFIEKTKIPLDIFGKSAIIGHVPDAGVAHPVERHLAKVEVASSSLVTRSIKKKQMR